MLFTKRLREPIKRAEITCSVRIWKKPHVRVGGRYALSPGSIVVDKLHRIEFDDITPALAPRRLCGRIAYEFPDRDLAAPASTDR